MKRIKRKILSVLFTLGMMYLPYSCSTTNGLFFKGSDELIIEDYDEFALDEELPESSDYVDEIADDDRTYASVNSSREIKIVDFSRGPSSIEIGDRGVNYYQVKPFDTLMLISYKIFGDYSRWRELVSLNKQYLNSDYQIIGTPKIRFVGEPVDWEEPMGKPYFIKPGDSLSKISRKVYGTMNYWREIFENNPRQIKNPNLIFAGFQLFYPSLNKFPQIN